MSTDTCVFRAMEERVPADVMLKLKEIAPEKASKLQSMTPEEKSNELMLSITWILLLLTTPRLVSQGVQPVMAGNMKSFAVSSLLQHMQSITIHNECARCLEVSPALHGQDSGAKREADNLNCKPFGGPPTQPWTQDPGP